MEKMKIWFGWAGILLLVSCAQKEKSDSKSDLIQINVNLSNKIEVYNIGNDIESWDICALETKDDCLVGMSSRIYFKNDQYFFVDKMTSVISVFNRKGEFVSKLDKKGGGPDDYLQINACTVVDKNVWIAGGTDLICYDENWHAIERQRLTTLPVTDMTEMNGCIYLALDWFGANCQLIEYNPTNRQQNCLRPLPKYDPHKMLSMGKQTQLALSEDGCLFIHTFCDTIFRISDHQVTPQYRFVFSERYEDIPLAMEDITKPTDRIRGPMCIFRTPNSVIFQFLDGIEIGKNTQRHVVYNEEKATCQVYEKFGYADLGNLTSPGGCYFTHDGEMIWEYDQPQDLLTMIDESKIKNEADRQKIHAVLSNIKEEDNPVLFRFKLKKGAGL